MSDMTGRPATIAGKESTSYTTSELKSMKTNLFQSIEIRKAEEINNNTEHGDAFRWWKASVSSIICAIDSELLARKRDRAATPEVVKSERIDIGVLNLAARILSDRILDGDTSDIDAAARESVAVARMAMNAAKRAFDETKETP